MSEAHELSTRAPPNGNATLIREFLQRISKAHETKLEHPEVQLVANSTYLPCHAMLTHVCQCDEAVRALSELAVTPNKLTGGPVILFHLSKRTCLQPGECHLVRACSGPTKACHPLRATMCERRISVRAVIATVRSVSCFVLHVN